MHFENRSLSPCLWHICSRVATERQNQPQEKFHVLPVRLDTAMIAGDDYVYFLTIIASFPCISANINPSYGANYLKPSIKPPNCLNKRGFLRILLPRNVEIYSDSKPMRGTRIQRGLICCVFGCQDVLSISAKRGVESAIQFYTYRQQINCNIP